MEIPANRITPLAAAQADPQQDPPQHAQTIMFWAAAAVAALCIDFGSFHRLHNSDSIVPVMVSLYRWTPFYWDQDRLGMLVPLLAIPFKNPLSNLLVQSAINVFCGLAAFFLCARYVVPRAWLFTGAVSASLFLLLNRMDTRFLYLGLAQPYGVGMFLGLAALLLLERSKYSRPLRITVSFICLLLASWVDAAVIFVLLPLIFFRWYLDPAARRISATVGIISPVAARSVSQKLMSKAKSFLNHDSGIAALLVFFSFAVSYSWSGIVSIAAADGDWPYPPVQPWRLPEVWFQFAKSVWSEYLVGTWGIAIAVLLVLGVLIRLLPRARNRRTNAPAAILIASSLASFLLMGSLSHIQNTEFDPRFALQSMVLMQIGGVAWALLPAYALLHLGGRRALTAAAMILFLCAPLYRYGRPSLSRVRADLDETLGQHTPAILQSGATHILGDYWMVWPATFHVNWTLYEMGSQRRIWGVTDRSTPTRVFWSRIPPDKMRLATVAGDPSVSYVLNMYSFPPVTEVQRFDDIIILKPAPASQEPHL